MKASPPVVSLIFACAAAVADPVPPRLVKDINTTPEIFGGYPQDLTRVGDAIYFRGRSTGHGIELWKTDGTEAGTMMVKDIRPGMDNGDPGDLIALKDRVFFSVESGEAEGFWTSDGTEEGTVKVEGFAGGARPILMSRTFQSSGGILFFGSGNGGFFASDGTVAGTIELNRQSGGSGRPFVPSSRGISFEPGILVFAAGNTIWQSDGTLAGTRQIATAAVGTADSLEPLVVAGDTIFFLRKLLREGTAELWKYTKGNSHLEFISADHAGGPKVANQGAVALGNLLVFTGTDPDGGTEPWASDGTAAGTRRLADIYPGNQGSDPKDFTVAGDAVYFSAGDPIHPGALWRSDGTPEGTRKLGDFGSGAVGAPRFLHGFGGHLYFGIAELGIGVAMWRTDGTSAGTSRLKIVKSVYSYSLRDFTELGGKLIFNGSGEGELDELWITDGTQAGTDILKDMYPGTATGLTGWEKSWLAAGADVYFQADDGVNGTELWKTNGTERGTRLLWELTPGSEPSQPLNLTAFGQSIYFTTTSSQTGFRDTLWRMNRSGGGLKKVFGPLDPATHASMGSLVPMKSRLAFVVNDDSGSKLWTTDGSARGTRPARMGDLGLSWETPLVRIGRNLYFAATSEGQGAGLWRLNGNSGAITLVKAFPDGEPALLMAEGGRLFFRIQDQSGDVQLWTSDGSPARTLPVSLPGIWTKYQGHLSFLYPHDGKVYFTADDGTHGLELWSSDGTMQGTAIVKDIRPGVESSGARLDVAASVAGGGFFFAADDGVHGNELWYSDGAAEGTRLVADALPGPEGMTLFFGQSAIAGRRLYLPLVVKAHGHELWTSDGTAEGTGIVADLVPGTGDSSPFILGVVGDKLYFSADVSGTGRELWVIDEADHP